MDPILARLEAVTARLEQLAKSGPAATGTAAAASTASGNESPACVAFDEYYSSSVQPFIDAANKFKDTQNIGALAKKGFDGVRSIIHVASQSKKPSPQDFGKLLAPVSAVIQEASKSCDNKSPFYNHQMSFAEALSALSWLGADLPTPVVKGQLEASDFYLTKILTLAKTAAADADNHRAFVKTLKALLENLAAYTKAHHTTGLTWNPRGGNANEAKVAAPAAAVAAPAAKPADEGPKRVGMGAVFGDLNKDLAVTSGLKKVTSDMKSKNMKDVPTLEPTKKAAPASSPKPAQAEVVREAKLYQQQGTYFCEYFVNDHGVNIADADVKTNIYIIGCKNSTITIQGKTKTIQLDGCSKVKLIFESVVSSVSTVNCKSVTITCTVSVPTVAIDKTGGCHLVLNDKSVVNPPQIVSSNISECTVQVPGKKVDDDPIEMPIPEQYTTTYKNWTLTTVPVSHG